MVLLQSPSPRLVSVGIFGALTLRKVGKQTDTNFCVKAAHPDIRVGVADWRGVGLDSARVSNVTFVKLGKLNSKQ